MYTMEPAPQPGPGTELIEHWTGMAAYFGTPSYSMSPAGQEGIRGMGCGMGCSDGLGDYVDLAAPQPGPGTELVQRWSGMGSLFDGTGLFGSGLFLSNDPGTWGVGEWAAIGIVGFAVVSMLDTGRRAGRATVRKSRAIRKAVRA